MMKEWPVLIGMACWFVITLTLQAYHHPYEIAFKLAFFTAVAFGAGWMARKLL